MTLDEAIAIADEIGKGDTVRAANNRWLAGKLRILKWVEECHVIGEARRAREEMHRWQTECVSLKAENEKLRELIADVHEALRADKAGMFHKLILANMEDDMRELGMELDG